MNAVLRLQSVSKRFGKVQAVAGFSLTVLPGEAVVLLGPNASGKSTVLALAAGLVKPDSGRVEFTTAGAVAHDPRRLFGYVPQQAVFPARLRVSEVLEFHASLRGCSTVESRRAAEAAAVPVADLDRQCAELSGGMAQRLALAVALQSDPPVLLLDEASANLDPQAAMSFRDLIRQRCASGHAVLLASHSLHEAAEVATRICILSSGRLAAETSGDQLRNKLEQSGGLLAPEQIFLEYTCHETVQA